ncbi:hypothetical protein [Klebsiella pneumoniae]|uniref:hypothetical protein n=1 Tax=Klebsiella pneumoniae TaxID=573 RepID=UPI000C7AEE10|nr:hypothetical protein B6I52_04195 [Klebsiella pneumoniae]PLD90264.1 hypothetical protein B6I63_07465 [Klebsiella pneumoniae]
MNIETVNELIRSLESAGEPSIREKKFLKLAKSFKQLAAENVALKGLARGWANATDDRLFEEFGEISHDSIDDCEAELKIICPATDRIVAGFKADGVAEREKTITFTAAKKRTQDGVALIAIGKPYKIHNDDVIGEFFIGERGRYGVITMDRLDYFTTSDEYAWEFSLREGAK